MPAAAPTSAATALPASVETKGHWLGWIHREWVLLARVPAASKILDGGVFTCDRCATLGQKSRICRAPNTFAGTCVTCRAHGHTARRCRTALSTSMHANLVVTSANGRLSPQQHYSSVPPPEAWPQQQRGFVMQAGAQQWNGGDVGKRAQHQYGAVLVKQHNNGTGTTWAAPNRNKEGAVWAERRTINVRGRCGRLSEGRRNAGAA